MHVRCYGHGPGGAILPASEQGLGPLVYVFGFQKHFYVPMVESTTSADVIASGVNKHPALHGAYCGGAMQDTMLQMYNSNTT